MSRATAACDRARQAPWRRSGLIYGCRIIDPQIDLESHLGEAQQGDAEAARLLTSAMVS